MDEDEAYRRLRQLASGRNGKLIEMARRVLGAEAVFSGVEQSG